MKQYEGTMIIKWHKNHNADVRPIRIKAINQNRLQRELRQIMKWFFENGDDPKYHKVKKENIGTPPFSISFNMSERK